MATKILVFSKERDTLSDIMDRLRGLECDPEWASLTEWPRGRILRNDVRIICDLVNSDYGRQDDVLDFVEWLLGEMFTPSALILVPTTDRLVSSFLCHNVHACVHRKDDLIEDDLLKKLISPWVHPPVDQEYIVV
jgi:hypothetical protein